MSTRGGFALVFSMLMVMALAVMALGILSVGTREAQVAGAAARVAQAGRRAEAAVLAVVEHWSTRAVIDMGVGEARGAHGAGGATAMVERLDHGLYLVRGHGRVAGPDGITTADAALLVRVLDPYRLARAFPAALTAEGPTTVVGTVDGASACAEPAPGVWGPTVTVEAGAVVVGDPPVQAGSAPTPPEPDPFDPDRAVALASVRPLGTTAVPRPLTAGTECVADGRNWGSPDPAHPCHALRPMILASTLTVTGGVGRGVLIVDGDLRLTGGTRLEGVVVVTGRLVVDGGAVVRGAVRAGSAAVRDGAVLRDECVLLDMLSMPALDRAFRPPTRWWVPVF